MSTLMGKQESRLLESEEELYSFFPQFAKPQTEWKVGMECEFFGVDRETGHALPYLGPRGIEAILCRWAALFHYEPIVEEGHVIALQRGETRITLEPGAQVELSAPPARTLFEIEKQLEAFREELREVSRFFPGVTWLSAGIHPFSGLDKIPWVPKHRYGIMASHFKSRGSLAHDMMKRTGTDQFNFDYPDEPTALTQFRAALGITSIVSALFAHSSFSEGKPNGWIARRLHIWGETDSDRCGLLLNFMEEGTTFRDYADYLLELPMIFIVRDEKWIPMEGISFRKFLKEGKGPCRTTWGDFELHLTTAFPEARFRPYLEIRGMDAQRFPLIPSLAAFWKGILYDKTAREKAWELVRDFSREERLKLHQAVAKAGLQARLRKASVGELAQALFNFSYEGLGRQILPGERSEAIYLDRVQEEILSTRRTPAETLLEKWGGEFQEDPKRLIRYLEI